MNAATGSGPTLLGGSTLTSTAPGHSATPQPVGHAESGWARPGIGRLASLFGLFGSQRAVRQIRLVAPDDGPMLATAGP